MIWSRLKDMHCPKDECGADLKVEGLLDTRMVCTKNCGFWITEGRFNELVNSLYKPKPKPLFNPEKNLSELNNLDLL